MAWIESHQSLANHRKTLTLKAILGVPTTQAIGHLQLLWWWAIDNAPKGDLTDIPAQVIAEACQWEGDPGVFVKALIDSRFLDEPLRLHNWEDYSGRLVTRREATTKRVRAWRSHSEALAPMPRQLMPSQKPPAQQATPKASDAALKLANDLRLLILANHPTAKVPAVPTAWAEDINRMLYLDKRKAEDVEAVINFCQHDTFWQANILSGKKLREKYDQLYIKMNGKPPASNKPQPGSVPSDAEIDEKERRLGLTLK